jgi:hypothetical protein
MTFFDPKWPFFDVFSQALAMGAVFGRFCSFLSRFPVFGRFSSFIIF